MGMILRVSSMPHSEQNQGKLLFYPLPCLLNSFEFGGTRLRMGIIIDKQPKLSKIFFAISFIWILPDFC